MCTYFKTVFIAVVYLLILGSCTSEIEREKSLRRPNVLFISIDDLRPELGCYGKDYMHSPNIDRLASQGVIFNNHFVQVPTCGASRYAMLTGNLPDSIGRLSNEAIRKGISNKKESNRPETFIHHLKRNGYYTVGIGKISHYADGFLYGFTDSLTSKRELPYSWNELVYDPSIWGTGWNAFFAYADGTSRHGQSGQVKPYEIVDVKDTGYPDGVNANLALTKLDELSKRQEPFFLGVGFFKPHLPFNAPKKYWDLYDEDKIPLAPNSELPRDVNEASLMKSGEFNRYYLGEEKPTLHKPASEAYERKLRHAYFASVSYIDAQVGKLLNKLEDLGLSENTIVVLWGDHGWQLGDHQMWGKHTIFEKALKSAFIIKVPSAKEKGKPVDAIVSTVDLYPTLMDLCNIPMPHKTDGKSLVPVMGNTLPSNWENASYGYFNNGITMRTERYRLTKYYRDEQPLVELYDYKTDPHETINIAQQHPEIVQRLTPLWEKGNTGLYEIED